MTLSLLTEQALNHWISPSTWDTSYHTDAAKFYQFVSQYQKDHGFSMDEQKGKSTMPVTDEKELKRYLSSELFKNQIRPLKLDWAQAAGRLLQIAIHGEIGSRFSFPEEKPLTRREKWHYQNRLDDARSVWAFRLDEDTLDFVHCDQCLEALALKDSHAMAETVWRLKRKTVH